MSRIGVLLTLAALTQPGQGLAQERRVTLVAGPLLAGATKELDRYVGTGYGATGGVVWPVGPVGLAAHLEYLRFPSATRLRPLPAGGTVSIGTALRVFQASVGPVVGASTGRLSVAAALSGGVTRATVTSLVSGPGDPERFTRGVVYDDLTWSAAAQVGFAVGLVRGAAPLAIGAAAAYHATGDLRLVREENLPAGTISGIYLPPTPTPGSWLTASVLLVLRFRA